MPHICRNSTVELKIFSVKTYVASILHNNDDMNFKGFLRRHTFEVDCSGVLVGGGTVTILREAII